MSDSRSLLPPCFLIVSLLVGFLLYPSMHVGFGGQLLQVHAPEEATTFFLGPVRPPLGGSVGCRK